METTLNDVNEKKLEKNKYQLQFLQKFLSLKNVCYTNTDLFLSELVMLLPTLFGEIKKTRVVIKYKNKDIEK